MPPNVKVCINGFVLSTLLFDSANTLNDQEGFLYGSITRNVRREISDHSMMNTQEEILISICSSVPSGTYLSFYNNVGEIKQEDLECHLADRAELQNIVGWYRFRRYSAMFPSAREQSIHRHMREIFNNSNRLIDTSYFVFGILSSSNLPNFSTHSYDYAFFIQRRDGTFRDLPLTILNLGDTRNSYRAGSLALPFMNSSSFNSVLQSSWNFETFFDTENQIHEFHQRLRAKLDSLQEELAASDAVNASLEDDIKNISSELQAFLATQDFENEERENAKSAEKSAEEAASISKPEETTLSTCQEKTSDLVKGEIPFQKNKSRNVPADVSSCVEDLNVPSPASNVEIGMSDTVDETASCLDIKELEDKKPPPPVSGNIADIPEPVKSLSDSDICNKKKVSDSSRCESAPGKFLSHVTSSAKEKLNSGGTSSKIHGLKKSLSNIHPPFIVYASKKPDDESSLTSAGSLHKDDSKPNESLAEKIVDENNKSAEEQENKQKDDVLEKSVKKMG